MPTLIPAKALSASDYPYLVDVRSPEEFSSGHIPGSVNVPLDTLRRAAEELKAYPRVVLVCAKGKRSLQAAEILESLGIHRTEVVEGGTEAWKAEGRPLAASPRIGSWTADSLRGLGVGLLLATILPRWRWLTLAISLVLLVQSFQKDKGQGCKLWQVVQQYKQPLAMVLPPLRWLP